MITSLQNPKIQRVRALLQRRKIRMETQAFVAEGVRLIEEASLTKCKPVLILYSQKLSKRGQRLILHYQAQGIKIEEITHGIKAALKKEPAEVEKKEKEKVTPEKKVPEVAKREEAKTAPNKPVVVIEAKPKKPKEEKPKKEKKKKEVKKELKAPGKPEALKIEKLKSKAPSKKTTTAKTAAKTKRTALKKEK